MPFPVCPSTKNPILCSKGLKMRVSEGKSAQKPRFCARNARKRGFQTPKSTKTPILCSGMIAASLAAPTGAQHCPPRALRGASGSSAPGNRLPQPTTQPAAVHAAGNCPRATYRRGATAGTPTPRTSYLPLILPCIPPWRYRRGATAKNYRRVLPPRNYRRATCPPGHTTLLWVPRPAGG